jgi:hypothetical protein
LRYALQAADELVERGIVPGGGLQYGVWRRTRGDA